MSESIINTFNICLPTIQYDSEFEKCQFLLKKEMFWRFKLSYFSSTDRLKVLRSRLKNMDI